MNSEQQLAMLERCRSSAVEGMTDDFPEDTCARCGEPVSIIGDWDNGLDWCNECCVALVNHARTDLPAALDALEAAEAEIARLRAVVRELREQVIVGDLAAMELTSGFLWTKQREAEYRANAEQITRKLTGETDNPITKETNHVL